MLSPFDLEGSIQRAERRFADVRPKGRRQRSDRGKSRMSVAVASRLRTLLSGEEYPGMGEVLSGLDTYCGGRGLSRPSRASVYVFMQQDLARAYPVAELPEAVRAALYNQAMGGAIPGAQLAFYCFNYGALSAVHHAAGLPWWPLYQAYRMRGWRPRSRGLLRAVLLARGLTHV
jgi:hypothetical protein